MFKHLLGGASKKDPTSLIGKTVQVGRCCNPTALHPVAAICQLAGALGTGMQCMAAGLLCLTSLTLKGDAEFVFLSLHVMWPASRLQVLQWGLWSNGAKPFPNSSACRFFACSCRSSFVVSFGGFCGAAECTAHATSKRVCESNSIPSLQYITAEFHIR